MAPVATLAAVGSLSSCSCRDLSNPVAISVSGDERGRSGPSGAMRQPDWIEGVAVDVSERGALSPDGSYSGDSDFQLERINVYYTEGSGMLAFFSIGVV
uniref:Lipoprotein n=1 Tax=Ascaris lumbricoides TaxID=6252 RepID=A0A0M3HR46_ASCLU